MIALASRQAGAAVRVHVRVAPLRWVASVPLSGSADLTIVDLAEGATETTVDGQDVLVCAGATDRAVQCVSPAATGQHDLVFALGPGRRVTGRCMVGRMPARATLSLVLPRVQSKRAYAIPLARSKGKTELTVATGRDGTFSIPHVEPGVYDLQANVAGRTAHQLITIPALKAGAPDAAVTVPDLRLAEGVQISISVRDGNGPLEKAGVGLYQETADPREPIVIEGTTDKDGIAKLAGADPSLPVTLTCSDAGHQRDRQHFVNLPAFANCTVARFASVRGVVVDPDGKPIASATVSIPGTRSQARTTSEGVFTLKEIPPAKRQLQVVAAGYAILKSAITVEEGADLDAGTLRLSPGEPVAGSVVDAVSGTPIAGALVAITEPAGSGSTSTDERGEFTITADADAPLFLSATADGYAMQRQRREVNQDVKFALQRPARLVVTVYSEGSLCGNCSVIASGSGGMGDHRQTGSDGVATFDSLTPGEYDVTREETTTRGPVAFVSGGKLTRRVVLRASETTTLRLGEPGHIVKVTVTPPTLGWDLATTDSTGNAAVLHLDATGAYSITKVPDVALNLSLMQAGRSVRVAVLSSNFDGAIYNVSLADTLLQVTCTRAGAAARGVNVMVRASNGDAMAWSVTDASGSVVVPFLTPGIYIVTGEGARQMVTVGADQRSAVALALKQ